MRPCRGASLAAIASLAVIALTGCDSLPGRPLPSARPMRPSEVRDFGKLYAENCAGCHGTNGRFGAALPLNNPVYLALVDDNSLRRVIANGVPGTSMPPFATGSEALLTDEQIDILIRGMRQHWGHQAELLGQTPAYEGSASGDARRGAQVYAGYCQSCHGPDGNGGSKAGSIVDRSYLALVSDQALRSLVIAGRPDLGHPDWRGYVPDHPLTSKQVSDVVAWLAAKRNEYAGRLYAGDH